MTRTVTCFDGQSLPFEVIVDVDELRRHPAVQRILARAMNPNAARFDRIHRRFADAKAKTGPDASQVSELPAWYRRHLEAAGVGAGTEAP